MKFSAACALLPMLVGTLVLVAWLITGNGSLPAFGLFTILLGCILCVAGVVALFFDIVRDLCSTGSPPIRWVQRGVVGLLLFANFPLAHLYVKFALRAPNSAITVLNSSGKTILSFRVTDPSGAAWELGPIPPNQTVRHRMTFQGEGSVHFSADLGGSIINGTVEGYISGPTIGQSRTVTINADGSHVVR